MMVQLNLSASSKKDPIFPMESDKTFADLNGDEIYKGQIQRKPKTANFDDAEDESEPQMDTNFQDNLQFQPDFNSNKGIRQYGKQHNIHTGIHDNINEDEAIKDMNYNDKYLEKPKEIEEMEDIDDEYDDEDEYEYEDDDSDENDEYDYDDKINDKQVQYKKIQLNTTNPVFKPGDFGDIRGLEYIGKPKLKVEEPQKDHRSKTKEIPTHKPTEEPNLVENGIYWSAYVEAMLPKGLSYNNITKLIRAIRGTPVVSLEAPKWNRCGRAKNAFATLQDKSHVCARYRHPHSSFVFGEVLSFYLSRLVGIDNVPVVVLATTNSSTPQWKATNFSTFEWKDNIPVALIQWITDIEPTISARALIPNLILQAYRSGEPIREKDVMNSVHQANNINHIPEIVQWGSMIIFDYLTGNYDRVASMQDAADREKKPYIIEEPIRNLRKSPTNGKLWLIDNESGLFDAYDLLPTNTSKFATFHTKMLQTLCIFQAPVVRALKKLYKAPSPHDRLVNFALSLEPLLHLMPKDDIHYQRFADIFVHRVKDILNWVSKCQSYSYKVR